jgi:putative transposase
MPRHPRVLVNEGYYHLIARGNNRRFIFGEVEGYEKFKDLLRLSKIKWDYKLCHYCLMSNHFHLLLQIKIGADLPKLMQYLLFEYSRWYRTQVDYVGHVWQGRYKSPWIDAESYFLECGRYIERNPVRAGLVKDAKDYSWSSYLYYAFGKRDQLIDEDPYYRGMGATEELRQKYYQAYVKLDGPYDKMMDKNLTETYF